MNDERMQEKLFPFKYKYTANNLTAYNRGYLLQSTTINLYDIRNGIIIVITGQ